MERVTVTIGKKIIWRKFVQSKEHGVDMAEIVREAIQNAEHNGSINGHYAGTVPLVFHASATGQPCRTGNAWKRSRRAPYPIPSFNYQMTPKISLNTRCSISISENLSINGQTRSSDQLGIWSYNINPCRNNECVRYFAVFTFNIGRSPSSPPPLPTTTAMQSPTH